MSQVNDIKVRLKVTIVEDDVPLSVAAATAKSIILMKPDGTVTVYPADFLTDGSDGIIYYDTVNGDLDQSGIYKIQGYIEIEGGTYKGSVQTFRINCNLS